MGNARILESVLKALKKKESRYRRTSGPGARVGEAVLACKIADLELALLLRKPEEKQVGPGARRLPK